MHHRLRPLAAAAALAAALTACAGGTATDPTASIVEPSPTAGAAAGTCLADDTDCADDPSRDPAAPPVLPGADEAGIATDAQALLGVTEAELPADVRVARVDDESYAITEDYVVGRRTVELDTAGTGPPVVTSVVVELADGPVTFTDDDPAQESTSS